ncbi:MAG TPA: hypothetical protein VNG12_02580 [Acidimicrobiales bacterium]|nr:hypothetical protein [Acidimicrobiales bacterium]
MALRGRPGVHRDGGDRTLLPAVFGGLALNLIGPGLPFWLRIIGGRRNPATVVAPRPAPYVNYSPVTDV